MELDAIEILEENAQGRDHVRAESKELLCIVVVVARVEAVCVKGSEICSWTS